MKGPFGLSALALALLVGAPVALAQSAPPPLPAMTAEQSVSVQQRLDAYRRETEVRVSRGEITADEADRLLRWREWQLAREVTGGSSPSPASGATTAPLVDYEQAPRDNVPPLRYVAPSDALDDYEQAPPDYVAPPGYVAPRDDVVAGVPPYYGPYYGYRPYYAVPRAYYWGPAVCAGGFGHHFAGRICF